MGASRSSRGRLLLWSCFCPVAGASSGAHKIGPCRQRARNPTARQGARADERSLCSPTRVAARPLRCSPTLSESRPLNRTPDPGSHSLTPGCCADQVECPDPAGRTLQLHEPPKRSVPLTADVFSGSTGLVEQIDVSRAGRVEPGGATAEARSEPRRLRAGTTCRLPIQDVGGGSHHQLIDAVRAVAQDHQQAGAVSPQSRRLVDRGIRHLRPSGLPFERESAPYSTRYSPGSDGRASAVSS